jgi:hypothetical protein
MKLRIKSTHNPAIFRGTKYDRIIGGTIYEVNGEKWDHAYVAIQGKITLDDIEWIRPGIQVVTQVKEWKVKSSKAGKFYTVRQGPNGKRTCDCDGFHYRRRCRHIAEVK